MRRFKKKLRIFVFDRDNWACVYCGYKCPEGCKHYNGPIEGRSGPARRCKLTLDHKIPKVAKPGYWAIDNFATACDKCNGAKGGMLPEKFEQTIHRPNKATSNNHSRRSSVQTRSTQMGKRARQPRANDSSTPTVFRAKRLGGVESDVVPATEVYTPAVRASPLEKEIVSIRKGNIRVTNLVEGGYAVYQSRDPGKSGEVDTLIFRDSGELQSLTALINKVLAIEAELS